MFTVVLVNETDVRPTNAILFFFLGLVAFSISNISANLC